MGLCVEWTFRRWLDCATCVGVTSWVRLLCEECGTCEDRWLPRKVLPALTHALQMGVREFALKNPKPHSSRSEPKLTSLLSPSERKHILGLNITSKLEMTKICGGLRKQFYF